MLFTRTVWLLLLQFANSILAGQNPVSNSDINSPFTYTPLKGWLNDPNGLVYVDGIYHLFYQYNPESNHPANICWGHATSQDLVDWHDNGVAIPYDRGYKNNIFSGNAVVDKTNSSGLGLTSAPIVAFMTNFFNHSVALPDGWSAPNATQVQSIAYSQDRGRTWIEYKGNPIIREPPKHYGDQYWSFRDPNVFWYQPHGKWMMTLVMSNERMAVWYTSQNLIDWTYTGEFGWEHTPEGEWECPALVEFKVRNTGERKWVLIISTNPGGLAGGSGMHYYVGRFDGLTFHKDEPQRTTIDWFDYGADCYAGVLWENVPDNRMIMSVWNNNWAYGPKMGDSYKGGISSRELTLAKVDGRYKILQKPIWQLSRYVRKQFKLAKPQLEKGIMMYRNKAYRINLTMKDADKNDFSFVIEDAKRQVMAKMYYIHTHDVFCIERPSPDSDKAAEKPENHCADMTAGSELKIEILIDNYVLTVFLKDGEYVFTEVLIKYFKIRKFRLIPGHSNIKADGNLAMLSKN